MDIQNWFNIQNVENVDSPSILLYKDRLNFNIDTMIAMVDGELKKLMPHVKTNKMPKVIEIMIAKGIKRFKASTIAEAEMVARQGGEGVLIAHQLVGPKVQRFGALVNIYPKTNFSTIIDNSKSLQKLEDEAKNREANFDIYIDVNTGMNRSGIEVGEELDELISQVLNSKKLNFKGLHAYDGHHRHSQLEVRKRHIEDEFSKVSELYKQLKKQNPQIELVAGGTPAFTSHLTEEGRICSPGTCVLWDWGYSEKLSEQHFQYAALLITRVISKPTKGIVTVDLGHKSVAAENPIDQRIQFLNLENYQLLSQSEEHGVLKVQNWEAIEIGDVLYGVPFHICPTINLHDEVSVISDQKKVDTWEISARKRKIVI